VEVIIKRIPRLQKKLFLRMAGFAMVISDDWGDGNLVIVGRIKDLIIRGGRILPQRNRGSPVETPESERSRCSWDAR